MMRGFRRFVLWFCFVVVAVASPVQSNEAGTPDSVAQMFETHYRAWRREMLTVLSGSSRTPDCSVRGTPLAMLGVPAVPVLLERYDEFGVPALFRFITKWGPQWQRGVGPDGEVISVCMELPMISGGSYAHVDSRLLAWRWWEEADVLVPRLFAERYRLWKESVAEGSPEEAAHRLQTLRRLGVWALPFMIEKVREGDADLIPSVSYLSYGPAPQDAEAYEYLNQVWVDREYWKVPILPADATVQECLDWWEANREHWTVPPPPAERITPEEKAFLQEWRAQRPAAGAARAASVCMRRWLTRGQVIGYAGPPAAATADGTLEYECTPGLRLALEFGRNGYVVAATFAQADEAAPAAQEPWTDEEREALRRMYGELSLTHMAPVASTCVTRRLTAEQVLEALGPGLPEGDEAAGSAGGHVEPGTRLVIAPQGYTSPTRARGPRRDGLRGSGGFLLPVTQLILRFDEADRVRSAQLRQPDHPMPPRGE